jgi:endogenous inhibitor of DNA gyrase (YacG/DUF329 family)
MVDLGAWFAEDRGIPGEPADPMSGDDSDGSPPTRN